MRYVYGWRTESSKLTRQPPEAVPHDGRFVLFTVFQFSIGKSKPLSALKTVIAASSKLGKIPTQHQRVFHLGREFKTSGRSLENLGVGRFGVNVVHVFSTVPPGQNVGSDDNDDDDDDVVEVAEATVPARARKESIVDLADDSDDEDEKEGKEEEDDDDCVVVEEVPPSKRRRQS
jgi:hypothetical protein